MIPLSPAVPHTLALGQAFGLTDAGTVRPSNQDNLLIAPDLNLLAVADGMGGHVGGDIASTQALTLLAGYLRQPPRDAQQPAGQRLRQAVEDVNAAIFAGNAAAGMADGYGMGTTLTGLWQAAPDGPLWIFHVGDSRIYRLRAGSLAQLTRDQTLYQQALEAGMSGTLPPRNLLAQAIGPGPGVRPDVFAITPAPGDRYLLCSDGLYGETPDATLAALLQACDGDGLPACGAALIAQAKQDGSRDNITAIVLLWAA